MWIEISMPEPGPRSAATPVR